MKLIIKAMESMFEVRKIIVLKFALLPIVMLFALGCKRLVVSRREDKVFPMFVSNFKDMTLKVLLEGMGLNEELRNLAKIPIRLDRGLYKEIKERYVEVSESLGNIAEVVESALDEERMLEFLKRDDVIIKINDKISIEINGVVKHTYMLHLALEKNFHPSIIKLMLEKGALLSRKDSEGNTPLFIAVEKLGLLNKDSIGDEDINAETLPILLKWAQEKGMNGKAITINDTNSKGMTLLQYALSMKEENRDLVEYILSIGANVRARNEQEGGLNALHYAVFARKYETIKTILESIEDIEKRRKYIISRDEYGRTALHFTAVLGDVKMWKLLIEELGCERYTFIQDKMGLTELHYAALNKEISSQLKKKESEKLRIKSGLMPSYEKKEDIFNLLCAKVFTIERSIEYVLDPEECGYVKPRGEKIIVEGQKYQSLFIKTNQGATPIHYIVLTNNIKLFKLAIRKLRELAFNKEFVSQHNLKTYIPLEIEELEESRRRELIVEATLFDIACIAGKREVVKCMLDLLGMEEEIDEEEKAVLRLLGLEFEKGINTPLHYAVLANKKEICEMLIGNPYTKRLRLVKNRENKIPLELAKELENEEIVEMLKRDESSIVLSLSSKIIVPQKDPPTALSSESKNAITNLPSNMEIVKRGGKEILMIVSEDGRKQELTTLLEESDSSV